MVRYLHGTLDISQARSACARKEEGSARLWTFPQWLQAAATVFGVSMLPVLELKAAIPLGLAMVCPFGKPFSSALLGSSLPVPLILFFLRPVFRYLRRFRFFARFADWFERHTHKRSKSVTKYRGYSLLGLFIFVAIPLPTTGVWTGSAIASFLNLRILYAFPTILLGNAVAGLLMLCFGIIIV